MELGFGCPCWLKPGVLLGLLTWLSVAWPCCAGSHTQPFPPKHFLALYHFTVTKWAAVCCRVLMTGRKGRWRETTGRMEFHFRRTIQCTRPIGRPPSSRLQSAWLQGGIKNNTAVISSRDNLICEEFCNFGNHVSCLSLEISLLSSFFLRKLISLSGFCDKQARFSIINADFSFSSFLSSFKVLIKHNITWNLDCYLFLEGGIENISEMTTF